MEEQRRAEHLITRLRWIALIAAAFVIDSYADMPSAALAIFGVFFYNTIATLIVSDNQTYSRYSKFFGLATRGLDLSAITLACHSGIPGTENLYLLYCFVIISTGYAYNSIRSILSVLAISITLDLFGVFIRFMQKGSGNYFSAEITNHIAIFAGSVLVTAYILAFRKQQETMRTKERKLSALLDYGARFASATDLPIF